MAKPTIFDLGEEGIVNAIFEKNQEVLFAVSENLAGELVSPSLILIKTLFAFVFVFYLYQCVVNQAFDLKALIDLLLRTVIFYSLVTLGAWFAVLVNPMLLTFPEQYGAFITENLLNSQGNPVLMISDLASRTWTSVINAASNADGKGLTKAGNQIAILGIGAVAAVTVGLMAIMSFTFIGGGQIVSAILIVVFPLFAAFGLLPATRDLFQAWIRAAIWAVVLQLVAYTIVGLVAAVFQELLNDLIKKDFEDDDTSVVVVFASAALMGALGTTMIKMTPMITSILGGAHISVGTIHPDRYAARKVGGALKRGGAALAGAAMARGAAVMSRGRASNAANRAQRIVNK